MVLTLRSKIEIAGAVLAVAALAILIVVWRQARADAAKLKVNLAQQALVVTDASKRETDRDAALKTAVASLETTAAAVKTPAQAIRAIPAVIPLPLPITFNPVLPAKPGQLPEAPSANIPAADLKPLYDFGIACQECKATLATMKADRKDDAVKLAAVTKERDDAIATVKGGTKWTRFKRAAKIAGVFVVVGAAGGVAAVCGTGHCK